MVTVISANTNAFDDDVSVDGDDDRLLTLLNKFCCCRLKPAADARSVDAIRSPQSTCSF